MPRDAAFVPPTRSRASARSVAPADYTCHAMTFAAPIWLFLLLPWAALAAWLLWGRREARSVPFLPLWRGGATSPRANRWFHPPPLAIVAALLAILLAILATARPIVRRAGDAGPLVTVILDRGATMSPDARRRQVIDDLEPLLRRTFGDGPTDLVAVPGGQSTRCDRNNWADRARAMGGTTDDTSTTIVRAAREALARTDGPIVVLTDQAAPADARVVRVGPTVPLRNVSITAFVVRDDGGAGAAAPPQAMVTIRNDSDLARGILMIQSGANRVRREIDLPPAGRSQNDYVDLPAALEATARAALEVEDDFAADNVWWLAREPEAPRIEIRGDVPAEVRRVVEAYQSTRPPSGPAAGKTAGGGDGGGAGAGGSGDGAGGGGGAVVGIVNSPDALPRAEPGVIVTSPAARSAAPPTSAASGPALVVRDHPVAAHVEWSRLRLDRAGDSAPSTTAPSGAGWESIVSVADRAVVAVRGSPARQVWLDVPAPALADFARLPDFVVLWTDILDWLRPPGERFASIPAGALGPEWTPLDSRGGGGGAGGGGSARLYRRGDGAVRAVAPPVVPPAPAPADASDWRARFAALARRQPAGVGLASYLAVVAVACVAVAAWAWPGRNLTPFLPPRTV